MAYIPSPKDVSDVILPSDLLEITELMAKNVHEVWAASRISQGWRYGAVRNDELKEHPCLIPYEELNEQEREYDRMTAIQTLKFIRKAGFNILKDND